MTIEFNAHDGTLLKGRVFTADNPKAAVLLNPGTAMKTGFYIPFAEFLAAQGYHVMLWNYRGFDESRNGSLAGSEILFSDIGRRDIPAAIRKARELFAGLPLYCIGHSAGGQQLGFAPNCNEISGLITLGSSTGHFGGMPLAYRLKAHLFFKVISPLSTALFGYVKASSLKLMEDLPPKLAREWGRWCSKENFMFDPEFVASFDGEPYYHDYQFPVHAITADDDEIATQANSNGLWKHITSSQPITFTCYRAADMPGKKIGHFSYFRRSHQRIWQDIVAQLEQFETARQAREGGQPEMDKAVP